MWGLFFMLIKDKEFVPYLSEDQIQTKVKELAEMITVDYGGKNPLFIAILNGSFMFASDLFKCLELECEITFIKVASYQQMQSSGKVQNLIGLNESIKNRDVIVLEDIVDTGRTMKSIIKSLEEPQPNSIEIATLLHKPDSLVVDLEIKYIGFNISDDFVVGYGMDYDGHGRNLKSIVQHKSD